VVLEKQDVLQSAIALEIHVPFPPGVDDTSDLVEWLMLEVGIMFGRFDSDFVGAIPGSNLEHPDSPQFDLGENAKSWKLVGDYAGEPAGSIWGVTGFTDRIDLRRGLVLPPIAKRASGSRFRRLVFTPGLRRFRPLSARRRNYYPPPTNGVLP